MVKSEDAVRMACGHAARTRLESGEPVCPLCLGLDPAALDAVGAPGR